MEDRLDWKRPTLLTCNDCGHAFEGDADRDNCPNCGC